MQEFKAKAKTTQKMTRDGVVETAFPTAPKEQPVTHIPTPPTATEKDPFLPVIHKKFFKELIGNQKRKHGLHGTRPYRGTYRPTPYN